MKQKLEKVVTTLMPDAIPAKILIHFSYNTPPTKKYTKIPLQLFFLQLTETIPAGTLPG